MVFDLYPFIPFLSQNSRNDIIKGLTEKVSSIEDELRKARALISLFKLRKVFG
jgi:hypothetical protein